jgi:hypothetical protein
MLVARLLSWMSARGGRRYSEHLRFRSQGAASRTSIYAKSLVSGEKLVPAGNLLPVKSLQQLESGTI